MLQKIKKSILLIFLVLFTSYVSSQEKSDLNIGIVDLEKITEIENPLMHIVSKSINNSKTPVLYFYADWCRPCLSFRKSLSDDLLTDAFKNPTLIKINTDIDINTNKITNKYNVRSIPTFIKINKDGEVIARITSAEWEEDTPENIAPVMNRFVNENFYDKN